MYEQMQKRYAAEAEQAREEAEREFKKVSEGKKELKRMLKELIEAVRDEIEGSLQPEIYEKFWHLRQSHPRIKKLRTSLICELTEQGFNLTVKVNGYKIIYDYEDEDADKIWHDTANMTSKYENVIKQLRQHLSDNYYAGKQMELRLEFMLDDNTVLFTWKLSAYDYRFKNTLREIFPEGVVHRTGSAATFNLD